MTNNSITREEIIRALKDTMEVSSLDIGVDVISGGRVVLTGYVDVLAEKHKAEEIVRGLAGVIGVENDLAVATDGNVEDGGIKAEVERKLKINPRTRTVGVEVNKGVVTLYGNVAHIGEAKAVLHTAESALGVKGVRNEMSLADDTPDDASLVNAIEYDLSKHHLSSTVDTHAHRGIVTLEGFADDNDWRRLAEDVAEQVKGVRQVINKIELRGEGR